MILQFVSQQGIRKVKQLIEDTNFADPSSWTEAFESLVKWYVAIVCSPAKNAKQSLGYLETQLHQLSDKELPLIRLEIFELRKKVRRIATSHTDISKNETLREMTQNQELNTISRPAATGDDDGDVRRRRNCGRYSAPGQNAPAVSTHEFAEAYRRWLWEYSLWTQSCLLLCSVPPLPTPYGNLSQAFGGMAPVAAVNGSAPGTASGQPPVGPVRFAQVRFAQQQNEVNRPHVVAGKECQVPALWKRVVAEFIDFFLLFVMKLVASIMFIDYIGIDIEKYDIDKLLAQEWDSDTALLFTSDLIAMEIANRIFICLFETFCLRQGFAGSIGGTTPGKYLMRLRVISCQSVAQLPGNKVLVIPGNDIGFWNALLRSVIKNFSLVFFFPVCFTAFFIPNSRTAYDISSSSIVVEVTPENLWAWPRR